MPLSPKREPSSGGGQLNLSIPVALVIFNRPHLARAIYRTIAKAKPKQLFIIADGPRTTLEAQKCLEARSIIQEVDWRCELLTNIADENLGCRKRMVTGLDWVFSLVDEAIILEDDCLPHESFFKYCATLLEYYRDDTRIMEIGGCNYSRTGYVSFPYSYFFSPYFHTWGWATWKRAWRFNDDALSTWPQLKRTGSWATFCASTAEKKYWTSVYEDIFTGKLTTSWDYQWQLARWCQRGLAVVPAMNLVSNLGYGPDATHTTDESDYCARLPVMNIGQIRHPPFGLRNKTAELHRYKRERFTPSLVRRIGMKLRRLRFWSYFPYSNST